MKRALSFLLAALMLLTLTACGSLSNDTVTLSEYLAGGQRIWFYFPASNGSSVSKDALGEILITQPGGSLIKSNIRYSLGEISQMADEEIVAMVESNGSCQYTSYKLAINTDATGNHTETESFCFPYSSTDGNYVLADRLVCDCGLYEIYQSYYDGFVVALRSESCLLTRVDKDIMFELDPVGTEGIPIDVKFDFYDF